MKNKLFYHVYLTENPIVWTNIVMEQLDLIKDTKLAYELDSIHVNVIHHENDMTSVSMLDTILRIHFPRYPLKFTMNLHKNPHITDRNMLHGLNTEKTISERITLKSIFDACQTEDFNVLYLHTKGITAHLKFLSVPKFYMNQYRIVQKWRQFLNWGVIENWRTQTRLVEEYFDVASVNFQTEPNPHYSGNFWWAKSSYIRNLPDPMTNEWWKEIQKNTNDSWLKTASDRFRDEHWITSSKQGLFYNLSTPKDSPATKAIEREEYGV